MEGRACIGMLGGGEEGENKGEEGRRRGLPSKIRTAVGKSLTLRAALRAAMMTEGEGTRSYAKALFRLR